MKSFRKKAVEIVKGYEKQRVGKIPKEMKQGDIYDIESKDRFIEVKSKKTGDIGYIALYPSINKLGDKKANYYIYYVYDEKKPKLKIIPSKRIFPKLEKKYEYILRKKHFNGIKNEKL